MNLFNTPPPAKSTPPAWKTDFADLFQSYLSQSTLRHIPAREKRRVLQSFAEDAPALLQKAVERLPLLLPTASLLRAAIRKDTPKIFQWLVSTQDVDIPLSQIASAMLKAKAFASLRWLITDGRTTAQQNPKQRMPKIERRSEFLEIASVLSYFIVNTDLEMLKFLMQFKEAQYQFLDQRYHFLSTLHQQQQTDVIKYLFFESGLLAEILRRGVTLEIREAYISSDAMAVVDFIAADFAAQRNVLQQQIEALKQREDTLKSTLAGSPFCQQLVRAGLPQSAEELCTQHDRAHQRQTARPTRRL